MKTDFGLAPSVHLYTPRTPACSPNLKSCSDFRTQRLQILLYNLKVQSETECTVSCNHRFCRAQGLVKELDDCEHCMQGLHTMVCASVFVNKDFLGHLITVKKS